MTEKYELLYIIPAKYTEDELKGLAEKVGNIVSTAGAEITESTILGKRRLAYPIKHVKYGYYVLVHFEAPKDAIVNMNRTLRLTTEVLRHLITVRDPHLVEIPPFADSGDIISRDREGERRERKRVQKRPAPQPVQKAAEGASMEDLDKKLDEILSEEVL